MKRILLTSIIIASMSALLSSCSCGNNNKGAADAELNDSTKTAIEMAKKFGDEKVQLILDEHYQCHMCNAEYKI